MKIRFLKLVDKYKPGDVADIGDSQANKLIWRKLAEKAPDEDPKVEEATKAEPAIETAEIRPTDEAAVTRTKPQPRTKVK